MSTNLTEISRRTGWPVADIALRGITFCRANPRDGASPQAQGAAEDFDQRTIEDCLWVPAFLRDIEGSHEICPPHLVGYRAEPRPDPSDWIIRDCEGDALATRLQVMVGDPDWVVDAQIRCVMIGDTLDFVCIAGDREERLRLRLVQGEPGEVAFIIAATRAPAIAPIVHADEPVTGEALVDEAQMARRPDATEAGALAYDMGAVLGRLDTARTAAARVLKGRDYAIYLSRRNTETGTVIVGRLGERTVFVSPPLPETELDAAEPVYRAALFAFAAEPTGRDTARAA